MAGSAARKLAFSLVPALTLLLLGEVTSRVVGAPDCAPVEPSALGWDTMLADPDLLWKLEPDRRFESPVGTTTTNTLGLRSVHRPQPKPGVRVAVTGDSSVFGWGQPDGKTYAEQLEQMLNRAFDVPVQVINMGVPGYSTEQTLGLLEQVGWSYEPDLIVVHNIFSDCNIDAFQDRSAMALTNPERGVLEHSRLYCAARQPWVAYQAGLNQETNRVLMPGMPTGANQARALEEIDQVIDLSRVPLKDYIQNLDTLKGQADARGAQVLMAPLAQEWDVGTWTAPMAEPTADQVLPWHPYRDAQRDWVQRRGLLQVDLPGAFLASGEGGHSLFIDHMHPSVLGAWVMATAVAEAIVANPGLLGLSADQVRGGWQTPKPASAGQPRGPAGRPGPHTGPPKGPAQPGPMGPPNPSPPTRR